jgi:Protein of unknown function (DUF3244).
MKPFLLGCLFALVCINAFGEEVNIELQKKEKEAGTRSLSFAPTATHDGNALYIYYEDYLLTNLQVTVKDLSGNTVYSNVIIVSYNQPYAFALNNVESGEYMLELSYENKSLYGYFYIIKV